MQSRWQIYRILTLHKMTTIQPKMDGQKLIKICLNDYLFDVFHNLERKTCLILGAVTEFKSEIFCILTLQAMNTFQPEMDGGKSLKLSVFLAFTAYLIACGLKQQFDEI